MLYFEDYEVGQKSAFGSYTVTREEIIEFASRYDPQPFHLSDEGAAGTHFKKLAASGWHTGAMCMAMLVENMKNVQAASLGSPGLDQLLWRKPVHAGDTLRVETELIDKRRSQSRPELGITRNRIKVFNQNDEVVMESINVGMVLAREPIGADEIERSP